MISAFLKFLDDEVASINPPPQIQQPAVAAAPVYAILPARGFADIVEEAYVAIEERRFSTARERVDELTDVLRERPGGPTGDSSRQCPHCSRRVASVDLHVRTCPALLSKGIGHSAILDPHADMVRAIKARLARAILDALRCPSTPPDLARTLWCAGAGLFEQLDAGSASPTTGVGIDAITAAFTEVAVRLFSEFAEGASRELQSVVSLRAVGIAGWQQQQRLLGSRAVALPPFLARFRAVLGPPPWDATGRPLPGPGGGSSSPPASGGGDSAAGAAPAGSVPHIDAATRLLSEASTWLVSVMEQPVPHRDRRVVADALHAACAAACAPLLAGYRIDVALSTVSAAAAALIAHVSRVPVQSSTRDPLDATLDVALTPTAAPAGGGGVAAPGDSTLGVGGSRGVLGSSRLGSLRSAIGRGPAANASSAGLGGARAAASDHATVSSSPLLPLYAGAALAIVDLCADQTSFLCQLLERYLRCLTVATARGPAGLPSRPPAGDTLAVAMYELQADYVQLEHAYVTAATRQLVCAAEGWEPVRLHEDARVITFAWVDDSVYVLSKTLARAAATCCDMAAAAALNHAAEAVAVVLGEAAMHCVALAACGEDAHVFGRGGGSAAANDEAEALIAAQLSTALLGRPSGGGGADSPRRQRGQRSDGSGLLSSGGGRTPRDVRGADDEVGAGGADRSDIRGGARSTDATSRGIWAVNSLHTATEYLRATFDRALGQFSAVFAEAPADGGGGGALAAGRAATQSADDIRHIAQLFRAAEAGAAAAGPPTPLQAATEPLLRRGCVSPTLLPSFFTGDADDAAAAIACLRAPLRDPLLQLHRVCASLPRGTLAAAWRLASATCGDGLRRVAALMRGARYVIAEAEFDWLAAREGEPPPLVRLVAGGADLLGQGSPLRSALAALAKPGAAGLVLACAAWQLAAVLGGVGSGLWSEEEEESYGAAAAAAASASWRWKPVNEYGALLMRAELRGVMAAFAAAGDALSSAASHGAGLDADPPPSTVRAAFGALQQRLAVLTLPTLADVATLPFPRPLLRKAEVIGALLQRVDLEGVYALPAPPLRVAEAGVVAGAAETAVAARRAVHGALRGGVQLSAIQDIPWEAVPVLDADAEAPVDAAVATWLAAQTSYVSDR